MIDPTKVPRQYCEPSDRLLRAAVASGVRQVDGIDIFPSVGTSVRA